MSIQLGAIAPDFTAETTAGRISFHDWADGDWVLLFSRPKARLAQGCGAQKPHLRWVDLA